MEFWCPKITTFCIIFGTFACVSKNLFFEYNFINIVQNQPKKTISRYTHRELALVLSFIYSQIIGHIYWLYIKSCLRNKSEPSPGDDKRVVQ